MSGIYFLREKEAHSEVGGSSVVGILKCGRNQWKMHFTERLLNFKGQNRLFLMLSFFTHTLRNIGNPGKRFKGTQNFTFSKSQAVFIFPYSLLGVMLISFKELTGIVFYIFIQKKTLYSCEIDILSYIDTQMRWSSLFQLKSFYDPLMVYLGHTGIVVNFWIFGIRLLISNLSSATCKFSVLEQVA